MNKLRLSTAAFAAILLGATTAHSQDTAKHKKHDKATKPAVETTTDPVPDPAAMRKWFSGAVGDILSNTDRTLNDLQKPMR